MRNRLTFLAVGLMLLATAALQAKELVKVGLITPITGDLAIVKDLAVIADKRMAELNKDPKNKFEYKLIIEDSKFTPKDSHAAAMKLLKVDKVDVLMTVASLSAKAVKPLAQKAGVPHLIMGGEELAQPPLDFTYFTTASDLADLTLGTAKALGYKNFSIMGQRQEAGMLMVRALNTSAKRLGLANKGEFLWNPSDRKDFRPNLLKAKEAKAELIVFFPTPPDPDILFRQMKELGIAIPVAGIESYDLVEDKKWVEGRWLAGNPPLSKKMLAVLKKYNLESRLNYTPFIYDFPGIMVQAVEASGKANKGKKPTGAQIAAAMASMKTVETSFGLVKQENNIFKPQPVLVYYQNGQPRQVTLEELKTLLKK